MNEKLLQELLAFGMDKAKAEDIAKAHPVAGKDVDVEALGAALADLDRVSKGMGGSNAGGASVEDLAASIAEAQDVVKAVTDACDTVIAEQREHNRQIAKGLVAIGRSVEAMTKRFAAIETAQSEMAKGFKAAVAAPGPVTSTRPGGGVLPPPGEQGGQEPPRSEVVNKALSIQAAAVQAGDMQRAGAMRSAISQLTAGAPVGDVVKSFNIPTQAAA